MINKIICALTFSLIFSTVAPCGAEARLEPTAGAIFSISDTQGWNAGLRLRRDRREFEIGPGSDKLDIDQAVFRLGVAPVSFINVWVEAGVVRAENIEEKASAGLQWGVGAYARIFELPLETSPVVGNKKSIAGGVEVAYSSSESNFDENDFNWSELRITPMVSYVQNRQGDHRWFNYEPEGIAVHAGPVFIRNRGDLDDLSVREKRDFGARIIFDILWASGFVTSFDATFIGDEERQLSLGVSKNF